jgi:hypothetical protein
MPDIDKLIRYENGELSEEETIEFFQGMIDSGVVWQLQGNYGRMASRLIAEGLCNPA